MADKLTARQQRFVDAYDGNATQAAIAAGYSAKNARNTGARMLTKANIRAALRAREKDRSAPMIATREERQAFWTEIMRDENTMIMARLKAAELLGKSEADFVEKVDVRGELTVSSVLEELKRRG